MRKTGLSLLVAVMTILPLFSSCVNAGELDLRPIEFRPEPLSKLHPKLKWMTEDKVRGIWIGNDLFEKYGTGDETVGKVLADADFNVVCVDMGVNSDDTRSGKVNKDRPYQIKYDRSKSSALKTRLASNVAEAHRQGLALMAIWKYGTHHLETYRKYRSITEGLAEYTCCPLEEAYIKGQHVGKWALEIAKGGADGMILDTEMYHSDYADYHGPCVCDKCFKTYLKKYARGWKKVFKAIAAEDRGKWLTERDAVGHYGDFAAKRTEKMYDSIRRKCQKVNPTFFFGIAPMLHHIPGLERGLGTASVPCLVFSEHEYQHGAYRGSFLGVQQIRAGMPALFLSGAYVKKQTPDEMANNVIQSSLYTDGWWPWYGTAFLNNVGMAEPPSAGDYGRVSGTTSRDYLDKITEAHRELDRLLKLPKEQWPKRQDGKLNWLKKRLANPQVNPAKNDPAINIEKAKVDLENYKKWLESEKGTY